MLPYGRTVFYTNRCALLNIKTLTSNDSFQAER